MIAILFIMNISLKSGNRSQCELGLEKMYQKAAYLDRYATFTNPASSGECLQAANNSRNS